MLSYPIMLTTDAETGAVVVDFPDIPFCHSVGGDEEEALLNAEDALESALTVFFEQRKPIPLPSDPVLGQFEVSLSALATAKVLLWNEMHAQGVRKADLARRLGCHMPQIDRLLDLGHSSKIEQVEAALAKLGKRLDVKLVA
ncbi:MAG: type II toxin-antitoxin system HicB family antitoxin [Methylococcaceae bacterium]|nr:type II toxin-antitoxin system HicB family antitoxin [Methylococcaceae bacterium]